MDKRPLTYAKIDLDNLKSNHAKVRELVGSSVKIMSVVKADGYGHGAVTVSKALLNAGTDMLGVANVEEAVEIRKGVSSECDIFILSDGDRHKFPEIIEHDFIPAVYDLENLKLLDGEAKKAGKTVRVHLKFDTSMGRLGFFLSEAESLFAEAKKLENIKVEGIMSHFSCADEEDVSYSKNQINEFNKIIRIANESGIDPALKHIANSAGIINLKESYYDMVRPGIMLFGSTPSRAMREKITLKPVMSVHSRIIQLKEFPAGKSISYSRTFTTTRSSTIATLPIGYADGMPRLLSNRGHVLVNGKKAPVVGNVTMDLAMIDVTDIPGVKAGDYVTIIGTDGAERITAWDIAETAGTISYEILTGISRRVKRIELVVRHK